MTTGNGATDTMKRWRRVRFVGESAMPLTESHPKSVVFVVGWHTADDGTRAKQPLGTGFLVSYSQFIPGRVEWYERQHLYVVTAAHGVRNDAETWVRFATYSKESFDLQVLEWYCHESADVAVAPINANDIKQADYRTIPTKYFETSERDPDLDMISPAHVGDQLYYIGLLASPDSMSKAGIPMVRSGTLGHLFQPNVRLRDASGVFTVPLAHLIDCRSYGGFSGSPVFVQLTEAVSESLDGSTRHVVESITPLQLDASSGTMPGIYPFLKVLGLISGHFDEWSPALVTGDLFGTVESKMNTGVGVVTPADAIMEMLQIEELAEMRDKLDQAAESAAGLPVATADFVANEEGRISLAPLDPEAALRALLATPRQDQTDD